MFMMHLSLLLACSLLLASTVLLIWSLRNKGDGHLLGITIGIFVFIVSLMSVFCSAYYGVKYWSQGHFETPLERSMRTRHKMMQKISPEIVEKIKERLEQRKKTQQQENKEKSQ